MAVIGSTPIVTSVGTRAAPIKTPYVIQREKTQDMMMTALLLLDKQDMTKLEEEMFDRQLRRVEKLFGYVPGSCRWGTIRTTLK